MNRRPHGGPKARHTHVREPRAKPGRLPPPRPTARLVGGPLDGLTVRVDRGLLDARTMPCTGEGGRYVHIDTDHWSWEADHHA